MARSAVLFVVLLGFFAVAYGGATACTTLTNPTMTSATASPYKMVQVVTKPAPLAGSALTGEPSIPITDPAILVSTSPLSISDRNLLFWGQSINDTVHYIRRNGRTGEWSARTALPAIPPHPVPGVVESPTGFGRTLASTQTSDGRHLIIACAPLYRASSTGGGISGACFIYEYHTSNGSITHAYSLYAPGMIPGDTSAIYGARFGYSIATRGNYIVIGAPESKQGTIFPGAAFLYTYETATKTFTRIALYDPATSPTNNGRFGFSVAISTTQDVYKIAVGAPLSQVASFSGAGRAFVFKLTGVPEDSDSSVSPGIVSSAPNFNQHFGHSVQFGLGARLLVGARNWIASGQSTEGRGAIFQYSYTSNIWTDSCAQVTHTSPNTLQFGSAIATPGGSVHIVTANGVDSDGVPKAYFVTDLHATNPTQFLIEAASGSGPTWGSVSAVNHNGTTTVTSTSAEGVWVGYTTCPTVLHGIDTYGQECRACSAGCPIACQNGVSGNGACEQGGLCKENYKSKDTVGRCDVVCSDNCAACQVDNVCSSCPAKKAGALCTNDCPTDCDDCFDGLTGNATCKVGGCKRDFYGPQCIACSNCATNECHDGSTGRKNDGTCLVCSNSSKYGSTCQFDCDVGCTTIILGGPKCNISSGQCEACASGYYGSSCTPCPTTCLDGKCHDGLTGNGTCIACPVGYYGLDCATPCRDSCKDQGTGNSTCYDGVGVAGTPHPNAVNGDRYGDCIDCSGNTYGPECTDCNCDTVCEAGRYENGACSACNEHYWGGGSLPCQACPAGCPNSCYDVLAVNSTSDVPNNGFCYECIVATPPKYGSHCNNTCSSTCASCNSGVNGDGSCLTCTANHWGPSCSPCPTNCPTNCLSGISADGNCTVCVGNFSGSRCDNPCPTTCATCNSGVTGDSTCLTCPDDKYGALCTTDCPSTCKTTGVTGPICSNSPVAASLGNGTCTECPDDRAGADCTIECPAGCSGGNGTCDVGPYGSGKCLTCPDGFWGEDCDQPCQNCAEDSCFKENGNCTTCKLDYGGADCSIKCPAGCDSNTWEISGACSNGTTGTGQCSACPISTYGDECQFTCNCAVNPGQCDHGLNKTGNCTSCQQHYYTQTCALLCTNERCSKCEDGIDGSGICLECDPSYFGPNCDKQSMCLPGACADCGVVNASSVGMCTPGDCPPGYYGPQCSDLCSDACSDGTCTNSTSTTLNCVCKDGRWGATCSEFCTCDDGICDSATGTCSTCNSVNVYGVNCDKTCADKCATCSHNITGDGSCTSCSPGRYGATCDNECVGSCNGCFDGVAGNGTCTDCDNANQYGPYCNLTCSACATCNNGPTGTGACETCPPHKLGADCSQSCPGNCSTSCFDGVSGNGTCVTCSADKYGPTCEESCPANCSVCNSGPTADGSCITCEAGFYGAACVACNEHCTGVCNGTTGACSGCEAGYFGAMCENQCPEACRTAGSCNDGPAGNGECVVAPSTVADAPSPVASSVVPSPEASPVASPEPSEVPSQGEAPVSGASTVVASFALVLLVLISYF